MVKQNSLFLIIAVLFPITLCAQTNSILSNIVLPDGFVIEEYANEVPNARSLALGSDSIVYVSTRSEGRVYAVVPQDNAKPAIITIAENLRSPNGIAYYDGDLYVAETTRIIRYHDIEENLDNIPDYDVVYDSLPTESHHGWRYIAFSPDGDLHVSIGSPCNVCDRSGFGEIQRISADRTSIETIAVGVRNSVGFTWHPETGDLWFTDNGRDMLGDEVPPDELNRVTQSGSHYGFPFCHAGDVPDPEFGQQRDCDEFVAPEQKLGPHVASLGLVFYDGSMFPDEYRNDIFIAEHGSWNRSQKIGYRVTRVPMDGNNAQGYEVFAEGWLSDEAVAGRPTDLLVMPDGSMLVSDDKSGVIYRIYYLMPLAEDLSAE